MVEKIEERVEIPDEASADEHGKVNIHTSIPIEEYERVKGLARYAAIERGTTLVILASTAISCFDLRE